MNSNPLTQRTYEVNSLTTENLDDLWFIAKSAACKGCGGRGLVLQYDGKEMADLTCDTCGGLPVGVVQVRADVLISLTQELRCLRRVKS